jgi:hypothetical protein
MKKPIFCFLFLVGVLAFAGVHEARAQRCKITDPTGTPLNVRASPNGRILRKIPNGTVVFIEDTSTDAKNRAWARISIPVRNGRRSVGWVFREFISCY